MKEGRCERLLEMIEREQAMERLAWPTRRPFGSVDALGRPDRSMRPDGILAPAIGNPVERTDCANWRACSAMATVLEPLAGCVCPQERECRRYRRDGCVLANLLECG